jgi:NAD(P)H-dependent FMN reductase
MSAFELDDIPLYNQDLDANMPNSVLDLKEKIRDLLDALVKWTIKL